MTGGVVFSIYRYSRGITTGEWLIRTGSLLVFQTRGSILQQKKHGKFSYAITLYISYEKSHNMTDRDTS